MALTLVTGRPNAGKSGILYQPILAAAAARSAPHVLFPTRPDARRAAEEFAARGATGIRTVVLDEWIAELWALYGDGRRLIDHGVREALIRRACAATPLSVLAASADTPGFARALASVAERIAGAWSPRPQSAEDREMIAVLDHYERIADAEGLVEPASAAVLLGSEPPLLDGPVAVNRFTDLSAAQEAFVCGLAAVTDVLIALPWEEGHPATEALGPLVQRIADAGEHVHVGTGSSRDELAVIERDLYRPASSHEANGSVVFAEAAGEEAESVLAIDLAAELIDGGIDPERIAIVFRNAASRAPLLEAAAVQAEVPVAIDVAVPLAQTAMGRALLGVLDAASGRDVSRETVLAFLHSPYSGATPLDVEQLDVIWRRGRVTGGRLLDDAASRVAGTATAVAAARAVCSVPVVPENVKKWKHLVDVLLVAAESRRGLVGVAGAQDCAVHREALRMIGALAGGVSGGVGEADARASLARITISFGGQDLHDAVVCTEIHRVRSRRFDALIVGGLTASEFSSERTRPFAAELMDRLGMPSGTDERKSERLLFYTAVTRPRTRLILLRQTTDAAGRALRPSVFWDEVLDLYREPGSTEEEGFPSGVPLVSRPLTALASHSVCYSPGRRKKRAVAAGRSRSQRRGVLRSEEVIAAVRGQDEFSVSELERYATCPYRWFFDRAIKPRELDVGFEAREAGSVAHDALAAFYARWSEPGGPRRVVPQDLSEALELAEEVVDGVFASAPAAIGLAEELAVERVKRWVTGAIEDDAHLLPGYTPLAHELAFGRTEGRPFEFGGVALRGRIDRVDSCGRGLVVTDYKSARTVRGHKSFAGGNVMQLPVYLAAAVMLLDGEADGAVYRSLSSRTARGFWRCERVSLLEYGSRTDAVDAEAMQTILSEAAERVAAAASGIRAGVIAPVAGGCNVCGSCPARATCGEVLPV